MKDKSKLNRGLTTMAVVLSHGKSEGYEVQEEDFTLDRPKVSSDP